MISLKHIPALLLVVGSFAACKSRKHQVVQAPVILDTAQFSGPSTGRDSLLRKDWQYFSGRLAVDYTSEEQSLSGTISLRMKRDSILWFSASAALGIQVAKGIITRDSVKILDLYEKRYMAYGIEELGSMFGVNLGLRELQNLILANPVFDSLTYRRNGSGHNWFAVENPLSNILTARDFSAADSSFLTQKGSMRQLMVAYSGQKTAGSFNVPAMMMALASSEAKTVRLDIEFTTASDAPIPSYPFAVPPDYER